MLYEQWWNLLIPPKIPILSLPSVSLLAFSLLFYCATSKSHSSFSVSCGMRAERQNACQSLLLQSSRPPGRRPGLPKAGPAHSRTTRARFICAHPSLTASYSIFIPCSLSLLLSFCPFDPDIPLASCAACRRPSSPFHPSAREEEDGHNTAQQCCALLLRHGDIYYKKKCYILCYYSTRRERERERLLDTTSHPRKVAALPRFFAKSQPTLVPQ